MNTKISLLKYLKQYTEGNAYPFHMPGHKRQMGSSITDNFPNPYSIDITEISGFDNLHHPDGILKEAMISASKIYESDASYFLINGSTCGILSSICGVTQYGGKILISRNCHKSVYHGVFLNGLEVEYIYPQIIPDLGLQGGIIPEEIEIMLKKHPDVQAVLIVSPSYEGMVSDIKKIANIVHGYDIPLIVDEAHGAHFNYSDNFPVSALQLGADIVIQSLHKTLPSFTQTAILHIKSEYIDKKKIEYYLQIFQSSSPSYVLMAGIQECIEWMNIEGRKKMTEYRRELENVKSQLRQMKHLSVITEDLIGTFGVFDIDFSKIVISTINTGIDGRELDKILREKYHIEMEMCGVEHVVALTSISDRSDGFNRLVQALLQIDSGLKRKKENGIKTCFPCKSKSIISIFKAFQKSGKPIKIEESIGFISKEFIYLYPPGIPVVVPGEVINKDVVDIVFEYKEKGFCIQGLEDYTAEKLRVVEE